MLNNLHSNIKFTMESNTEKLPFLDILICKNNTEIYTDIYYKTTDSHQYLDFFSCHPKHTKFNIPFTLARRICTIVKKENKEQRLQELAEFLRSNHYPEGVIMTSIEKVKALSIEQLRSTKEKNCSNNKILSLVITHNPNNSPVIKTVKEHLKFLSNSTDMKEILEDTDLIVSRRQPQNLQRMLTKAAFSENTPKAQVGKCNDPKCGTCDIIITGDSITLKSGKTWYIKSPMSCKTKEVIYLIIFPNCGLAYVGQTNNLRNRVTLHRQQIKHEQYRHLTVSKHIAQCSNGNFRIMPILKCTGQSRVQLECNEKCIIILLQPGLNCDS